MRRIGHARGFDDQAERATLLALLAEPGCSVCRTVDQATSRYLFWFVNESFQQPETLAQLRSNLGMCPRHTRDLVKMGEASVLTTVLREVLPAAAARLGPPTGRPGCPACASAARAADYRLSVIARLLDDRTVVEAYRAAGGLCVAHTLQALPGMPTRHAQLLVLVLQDAVTSPPDGVSAVEVVAGTDPDATTRYHLRELLPGEPVPAAAASPGRATLERLHRLLGVDACPACLANAHSERRYLRWLAAGADGKPTEGSRGVAGADPRAASARAVLLGRLDVLRWELAEADRKQAWALRYHPTGPETSAWLRAAAMVDGGVFLGGPAWGLEQSQPGRLDGSSPPLPGPPIDSVERHR